MEDLDTLKLFNGQRSIRYTKGNPDVGVARSILGVPLYRHRNRNAAHVGELLVVYDHYKIM